MPADGDLTVVKLGSDQDTDYVRLRYNADRSLYVSRPLLAVRSIDQIGAPLNGAFSATTKQYVPISNNPPFNDYFSPRHVTAGYTAGLSLEYRQSAWLAGSGGAQANVGTYFYEYDDSGAFNTPDGSSNADGGYTNPPTGGAAETAYLNGGGMSGTREYVESGWSTLNGLGDTGDPAFTKQSYYAAIYMYEDSGGDGDARLYNYVLWLRWVK